MWRGRGRGISSREDPALTEKRKEDRGKSKRSVWIAVWNTPTWIGNHKLIFYCRRP